MDVDYLAAVAEYLVADLGVLTSDYIRALASAVRTRVLGLDFCAYVSVRIVLGKAALAEVESAWERELAFLQTRNVFIADRTGV